MRLPAVSARYGRYHRHRQRDGSADPGKIPRFVKELLNGADFAKGTRFAMDGGSRDITGLRTLVTPCNQAVQDVVRHSMYRSLLLIQRLLARALTDSCLDTETPPPEATAAMGRWIRDRDTHSHSYR